MSWIYQTIPTGARELSGNCQGIVRELSGRTTAGKSARPAVTSHRATLSSAQSRGGTPGGDWQGDGIGLPAPAQAGERAASRVGDKAEVSAKGLDQRSQKVTEAGEVIKEVTIYESSTLDAVREVLATSEKGWPIKLKFTVKSLKFTADKEVAPSFEHADAPFRMQVLKRLAGDSYTLDIQLKH